VTPRQQDRHSNLPRRPRAESEAIARSLRAEGLTGREIAARMGVARSTVDAWLNDPGGARLRGRKDTYRGVCEDCGAPTDGSNGTDAAPARCRECCDRVRHEERKWTPQTIVAAISRWAETHGRPPVATDWNASLARQRGRPKREAAYPPVGVVQQEFGSWNAAIAAAGFTPFDAGYYGRDGEDPDVIAETVRLYRTGLTAVEIAARMGCSSTAVCYRLAKAGEPRRAARPRTKRELAEFGVAA
jgi:transcriptional regulator with XRE-family HTH domain